MEENKNYTSVESNERETVSGAIERIDTPQVSGQISADEGYDPFYEPKYTLSWLGKNGLAMFIWAVILIVFSILIDHYAYVAMCKENISYLDFDAITKANSYTFILVIFMGMLLTYIDMRYRADILRLQYGLMYASIFVYFLLMEALTEICSFPMAYLGCSVVLICISAVFVQCKTKSEVATSITAISLTIALAMVFVMSVMSEYANIIGAVSLVIVLVIALYLSLRLRVVDEELTIK